MKLNDGEAKEAGKDNEALKEDEKDKYKDTNGTPKASKLLTNGVTINGSEEIGGEAVGPPTPKMKQSGGDVLETPTHEGKQKTNDGGMISPESLEAM